MLPKVMKCKYCDKCFSLLGNCKQHERTHTGVKPYQCNYCSKCFTQSSHCKEHERTHTGVKPYQCKYCNKCFTQSSHCKEHERIHTGVKPYQCKYCDKSFSKSSHCKQHEHVHTDGVKNLGCSIRIKFVKNCPLPNTRKRVKGLSFSFKCSSASVKFPVGVKRVPK